MAFNTFMHDRNIYKERPDFTQIAKVYPELQKFLIPNNKGKAHVDFTDPEALRTVTKVLLKKDFDLAVEIPDGFLIPTIPQRLNYILWIEDLLTMIQTENEICGIDIGTGPCAIFSLLGAKKNAWRFISTETSDEAIEWATKNINVNNLDSNIKVIKVSKDSILEEIFSKNSDKYDFCLCNPPFFGSIDEIRRKHPHAKETIATLAKESEILSEGGEVQFVKKMIKDSFVFKDKISLFTSMFGKKKSFLEILKELESIQDITFTKTEFCQGNTVRWGLAWTFLKGVNFQKWEKPKPKKPKKNKPPMTFQIPINNSNSWSILEDVVQQIQNILHGLEIPEHVIKSFPNYVEMQVASDKNTWSHQRQKRRQLVKESINPLIATSDVSSSGNSNIKNKGECSHLSLEKFSATESSVWGTKDPLCDNPNINIDHVKEISLESRKLENNELKSENPLSINITQTNICSENNEDCQMDYVSMSEKQLPINNSTSELSYKRMHEQYYTESCKKAKIDLISSTNQQTCIKSEVTGENDKSEMIISDNKKDSQFIKTVQLDTKCNKIDESFSIESLLYCCLKLRKRQTHIILEMNCPLEANRNSMYQIFQLLKNKLKF